MVSWCLARKIEITTGDHPGFLRLSMDQPCQIAHLVKLDPGLAVGWTPISQVICLQVCIQDNYPTFSSFELHQKHTFIERPIGESDAERVALVGVSEECTAYYLARGHGCSEQPTLWSYQVPAIDIIRVCRELVHQWFKIHIVLDFLQAQYGWPKLVQYSGHTLDSRLADKKWDAESIQGQDG